MTLQYTQNSRPNYYLMADGTMDCFGDVIIDGTLYLKNVRINTDAAGFRLYVTGFVFV